ncbi:MAG: hypothetical protein HRT64_10390 [Erythrobacter sp.]|nr:hypothetical protein [Erythrobacter sp.]
MSDLKRLERVKKQAEKSAYQKGIEEGWRDAILFVALLIGVVAALSVWIG